MTARHEVPSQGPTRGRKTRAAHKPIPTEVLIVAVVITMVLGALIWRTRPGAAEEVHPVPVLAGMVAFPTDAARSPFIRFEAEDADIIEPSFKVKPDPECSGAKFVSLPEDAGSLWTKSGVGRMLYTVTIPEAGEYALWGRVKWEHGCSCQLDVDLGGAKPVTRPSLLVSNTRKNLGTGRFGKNTTLEAWHWLGQDTYQLPAGKLTFTVTNLEDGVAIDQWLITSDIQFKPRGEDPLLARETFTKGHEAAGWRYDPQTWTIMAEGERAALVKSDDTITPACLAVSKPGAGHTQFTWTGSGICRIYQSLVDDKNFDVVESLASSVRFRRYRNGRVEREETASLPGVMALDTHTMEVFRDGEKLVVMRDHEVVLRADGLPIADGLIGVDVGAKGRILSGVFQPKTAIRESDYFYLPWGGRYLTALSGDWKAANENMTLASDTGTLVGGEDWWRDMQFTVVACPPSEGTWGMAVCYRDEANQLRLVFENNHVLLIRLKHGVKTVLGTGVSKSWRTEAPNRITINRLGDRIDIFVNGTYLFDATDTESYAGKVALFVDGNGMTSAAGGASAAVAKPIALTPNAKPKQPLRLYDSFAANLSEADAVRGQEQVQWQRMPHRIINTVLDSFGATGGFHPGDYRSETQDRFISTWEARLQKNVPQERGRIIDAQWASWTPDAFQAINGLGQGPGYILCEDERRGHNNYLWALENLAGDNEIRFSVEGMPDCIGIMLTDVTDAENVKKASIRRAIEIHPREKSIALTAPQASTPKPIVWNESGEQDIRIRQVGGSLQVFIDEQPVLNEALPPLDRRPMKLALYYSNGIATLDDLQVYLHPDRNYEFGKSKPLMVNLSAWDIKATEQRGGGGYYMTERFRGTPAQMISQSFVSGDVTVAAQIDAGASESLAIGIDEALTSHHVIVTSDSIKLVKSANGSTTTLQESTLDQFHAESSRLTTVWMTIQGTELCVFLSDNSGPGRIVLRHAIEAPKGLYRIRLEGAPYLEVRNILMWGKCH